MLEPCRVRKAAGVSKQYAEGSGIRSRIELAAIHGFGWFSRRRRYRACHVRPAELDGSFASAPADDAWRWMKLTMPYSRR